MDGWRNLWLALVLCDIEVDRVNLEIWVGNLRSEET